MLAIPMIPLQIDPPEHKKYRKLLDPIFDYLHGRTDVPLGGQTVVQILRRVSAPMGSDANHRWERADQYYSDVDAAPTALRPAGGAW